MAITAVSNTVGVRMVAADKELLEEVVAELRDTINALIGPPRLVLHMTAPFQLVGDERWMADGMMLIRPVTSQT